MTEAERDGLEERLGNLRVSLRRLPRRFRRTSGVAWLRSELDELEDHLGSLKVTDVPAVHSFGTDADAETAVWLTQEEAEALVPTVAEEVDVRLGCFERNAAALVAAIHVRDLRAALETAVLELLALLAAAAEVRPIRRSERPDPPPPPIITPPLGSRAPCRRSTAPPERARVGRLAA